VRFLTDAQPVPEFVQKLRALDFDVIDKREVLELQWENDDVQLLRWARRHQRILLGMDMYARTTGLRMNEEIRERNGRVLSIAGGPQQPVHRALGKLLFYQERWAPFFAEGHGRVTITTVGSSERDTAAKIKMQRPHELTRSVSRVVRQGQQYLDNRAEARKQPIRRRAKTYQSPDQQGLARMES